MVNVYFIRKHGKLKDRGFVADVPNNFVCRDPRNFIILQIDENDVPDGLIGNPTVQLKLDKLQKPNKVETVTDIDGSEVERVVYDYYHEQGHSCEPYPVITMEDVTYE